MHKAGTSVSDIARAIGRSYVCVRKYLASKKPYETGGSIGQKPNWRKHRLGVLISRKPQSPTKNVFFLVGPDGMRFYWCREMRKVYGKKDFSRGLGVWAGLGFNGTTSIHFCEGNVNSDYYQYFIE